MSIRAKFKVDSVTSSSAGGGSVYLSPVTGGNPENDKFYQATPSGHLELKTVNEEVFAQFLAQDQDEWYVDFTPA